MSALPALPAHPAEAPVVGLPRPRPWIVGWLAIPTGLFVGLSVIPMVGSLFMLLDPSVLVPVLAVDGALVAFALADLLATRGEVEVWRAVAPVQAVGRPFTVQMGIRNVGGRLLRLRFADDAPGPVHDFPEEGRLGPGEETIRSYQVTVDQRGQHRFGDIVVRWRSPLGLWERQRSFDVDNAVRVYPDFGRLRDAATRGRVSEERVPVRARRRSGGENEFQRLRPYVAGDSYRHIDWKATARRRDYITREFGQESNQNLIFLLDCGRMMAARSGPLTAFDHALNAAILLGQRALRHGDRVGLLAFDTKPRVWLAPQSGKRSAGRLIRATYDIFPSDDEPDYAMAFRFLNQRVRRRSLVVLLTSVIDEVSADMATQLVAALASRHLPVAVWIKDQGLENLLVMPVTTERDAYVRAAAAEVHHWRDRALASVRRRGALVVDGDPNGLTSGLLDRYLEIKARRLL